MTNCINGLNNTSPEDKVLKNLGLVHKVLNDKFFKFKKSFGDDLIQEGNMALINCANAKSFDETMNTKFSTYAYTSIQRAMVRYIKKEILQKDRMVNFPMGNLYKPKDEATVDRMIINESYKKIINSDIPEGDKELLMAISNGSIAEIKQQKGCTYQNIHNKLRRLRSKLSVDI